MRIQAGALFAILLLAVSCTPVDQSAATNRANAERWTNEAWNAGNLDVLDEIVSADFVRHNPPSADTAEVKGLDALKEYISGIRSTYPDFHVEIHSRLNEGDLGASNWTVTGTNSENGIAIEFPGISIARFQDGRIVEEWVSWDTERLNDQLEAGSEPDSEVDDED